MLKALTKTNPPYVPKEEDTTKYHGLVKSIAALYAWARKLNLFISQVLEELQVNSQSIVTQGADIASAATIKITNNIHRVTGTTTINTITPPPDFVGGPVWLLVEGAFSLSATGNIEIAGGPFSIGQVIVLVWDATEKHWHFRG